MRTFILTKLVALLLMVQASAFAATPAQTLPLPPAPAVNARAALLMDFTSGQLLHEMNAHERMDPASLTKMMTAHLVFAALRDKRIAPSQIVQVSPKAWRAEGSRMFIQPDKPVTVEELVHGMITQSGNDACIALAEAIAGSEETFAQMMNQQAARLGMKNTNFTNATGLPHAQHYSTAYDLALLAAATIREFPEYYPLYAIKEYRYNNITQPNRNRLLYQDPYVDGIKTGHTESAGYCLVASAKRGAMRLISVVMGSNSDGTRTAESQKLLNYGFQFYETPRLYQKGQTLVNLPVWKGEHPAVKAGVSRDIYVTLPKGQAQRIKASLTHKQPLLAPFNAGQPLGTLRLALDNKVISEYPLIALENAAPANFFKRTWHSLKLWLNK